MTPRFSPTHYAIDFGTTKSLLSAANAERVHAPIALDDTARDPSMLRRRQGVAAQAGDAGRGGWQT